MRNLRQNLEAIGSELLVAHDRPENFLSTLVSADQKVKTTVVYQQEVCSEELAVEDQVIAALLSSNANVDFVSVWGSTLHHVDDLPYNPRAYFPHIYGNFVKKGANTPVRDLLPKPGKGELPKMKVRSKEETAAAKYEPQLGEFNF